VTALLTGEKVGEEKGLTRYGVAELWRMARLK